MKKPSTLQNILHSEYGSTVLPEHYCSLIWSHYLLTSQNKTLLKGFLTEVLRIFPNIAPKNTINLLKFKCVQDTNNKNNFENQNWVSRVSIYELSTIIFMILSFSRKYSETKLWWGNIISTTGVIQQYRNIILYK